MKTETRWASDFRRIIQSALVEDDAGNDLTTQLCIPEEAIGEAEVVMKSSGIVSGLLILPMLFAQLGGDIDVCICAEEGSYVQRGAVIAKLQGKTRTILSAERVLLNLVQLSSSVSTKTRQFVDAIKPYKCDILDTRKTLPGLRSLQKYAVKMGGGKNHRENLSRYIIIKDNHLAHVSIAEALQRARQGGVPVEIEVDTLEQLIEALQYAPDAILLDNMSPEMIKEAVQLAGEKTYLEASGGITLASVLSYAKTGVHGISIGALTHTIDAVDISLNL